MAVTSKTIKVSDARKEMKKELAGKIEAALPDLKKTLGEKKFQNRVKKATKVLLHGINEKALNGKAKTETPNLSPDKTQTPKKVKAPKSI